MNKVLLQITLLGFAIASAAAGNLSQATITRVVKNVEIISQGAQPKPANVGETVGGGNFFIFSRRENGQSYLPDCLALAAAKVVTVVEADHGSAFNPH